jgi:acylphosphatase
MQQLHLKIYGQVQGVFFRDETEKKAKELSLVGCVKNTDDPSSPKGYAGQAMQCVEVIAEGKEKDLKKLLEWCKIGPPLASVTKVEEEWEDVDETNYKDFKMVF